MGQISSRWSRLWGAVSATAFWLGLGAALFDAAVIAPLWMAAPPASVRAWADLAVRPEPERLFVPFAAVLALTTLLAWLSGLRVRGSRRWWLTLATLAAFCVVWACAVELGPIERSLASAPARDDLDLLGLAEQWLHWSLFRLGALTAGSYAAHRGHLAQFLARCQRTGLTNQTNPGGGYVQRGPGPITIAQERPSPRRGRRREDFIWSDDDQ